MPAASAIVLLSMRTASRDLPAAGGHHPASPWLSQTQGCLLPVACCPLPTATAHFIADDNQMVFYRLSGTLGGCDEAINGGHRYFDNRVSQGRAQLAWSVGKGPRLRVRVADGGAMFLWNERHNAQFSPTPPTSPPPNNAPSSLCGRRWCHFDPMAALHDAASPATTPIFCFSALAVRAENGPPAAAGRTTQLDSDRCLETPVHQQPSPRRRVDVGLFSSFNPTVSPRGAGWEDRHATYSSQTSSPDQYIPTEHGMPTRPSVWPSSRPPDASYCRTDSVLEYEGDAETTAHSQAPVACWSGLGQICRCTTRSSATLPLEALPSVVRLGQADAEATARSLRMEQCVPGIIGSSVDLVQLLGWWRR